MKKMLITGGTVFVSRYAAQYFSDKYETYVLNRNTRPQCNCVTLIEGDRHKLGDALRGLHFDVVLDITAYDEVDVNDLLDGLESFGDYIMVSSSAVYPEYEIQPFREETDTVSNHFWGTYGTNKIAAEKALLRRIPSAYILRPPYLYGSMNNVYREAFVFDCAIQDRPFYLPGDGSMRLQFFHVRDLCRFVEILLANHPLQRIFNVGNPVTVSIREWVTACYRAVGKTPVFISVNRELDQRSYFPFYAYEYQLDVRKQTGLMPDVMPLSEGLRESYAWYVENSDKVVKKPLLEYIDNNFPTTRF